MRFSPLNQLLHTQQLLRQYSLQAQEKGKSVMLHLRHPAAYNASGAYTASTGFPT
jgi:hypothetical protein